MKMSRVDYLLHLELAKTLNKIEVARDGVKEIEDEIHKLRVELAERQHEIESLLNLRANIVDSLEKLESKVLFETNPISG